MIWTIMLYTGAGIFWITIAVTAFMAAKEAFEQWRAGRAVFWMKFNGMISRLDNIEATQRRDREKFFELCEHYREHHKKFHDPVREEATYQERKYP